jgi:hypothetical protein
VARPTPPALISYTEVAYTTTTATLTSASVAWQTGDLIVVIALAENAETLGVPAATGLTFTSQKLNTAAGTCASRGSTAVAASSSSATIAVGNPVGATRAGFGVWVWRGSDGVGNSAEQHTTTRTVAMVPNDTHSAFCWSVGDFAAGVTTSVALTPAATNTQESAQQASHYTVYSGNLNDQASAGSTNFGTSGGTVTGPSSIVVIEALGTDPVPPPLVMAPPI